MPSALGVTAALANNRPFSVPFFCPSVFPTMKIMVIKKRALALAFASLWLICLTVIALIRHDPGPNKVGLVQLAISQRQLEVVRDSDEILRDSDTKRKRDVVRNVSVQKTWLYELRDD